ncbi:beta strand repeat-containing protein [Hyphobacterium sp.]|uniref:beta strand repeat-containing protein n=1 Tax=Hyphobacterium sp. TaxID=2004662 RepID=UPI003B524D2A
MAVLTGGGYVIVWRDNSASGGDTTGAAIRAQRYDAAGAAAGGEFLVNTTTIGDQYQPSVAALTGGGFVIAWSDSSATGGDTSGIAVRAQRYDAAGAAAGGEFLVNTTTTGDQMEPDTAGVTGGGFVIVWRDRGATGGDTSGDATRAQRYDAAGVAVGGEFLVNTTTSDDQYDASVAALTGGGFVIVWRDNSATGGDTSLSAIRAQRYDAAGAAVGGEFLVNTTTSSFQYVPSIAPLSDGGFVIAWADDSQTGGDTSNGAVRAQRYDAAGASAGSEFLVNTTTSGVQYLPSVGALSDGGFVIAWDDSSSTGGDISAAAVRAQRYDAAGAAAGAEFLVNTTTSSSQSQPSADGLSGGGLVISWTDASATGGDTSADAVRAQRFDVPVAASAELVALDAASPFSGQTVASEVGGILDGNVILDFGLSNEFENMGAGGTVVVAFTLTNATFDGPLSAGSWTAATEADCDFGEPVFGGGAGGDVVRFENTGQINQCSGFDANDGTLTLPIVVTNNGDPVSVTVTFTPTADAGTYTGSSDDLDLLAFAPAFDFSITAGAAGAGEFDASGDDLQGSGLIGTLTLADFPADIESDIGVALADATDIAASAQLVLTFPDGVSGIDETNIVLGGVSCTQGAAPSDNVFTCALGGGDLDGIDNGAAGLDITIDDDANAATFVTTQTPTAVLTVTGNPNNTVSGASGDLAEIELDDGLDVNAITNSNFDWVRFGSGGTESNFRIALPSTAEAEAVMQIQITVVQGNNVAAGTINLTPGAAGTGFQVKGATVTFNSRALGATSGETGNANITSVALQHDETALLAGIVPGLTILRQLVNRSPGSFIATGGLTND